MGRTYDLGLEGSLLFYTSTNYIEVWQEREKEGYPGSQSRAEVAWPLEGGGGGTGQDGTGHTLLLILP